MVGVFPGAASGHDGDPKQRGIERSIPGQIVRGGIDGVDSNWGDAGQGVVFASQVPVNVLGGTGNGSDLWHYVSQAGREYGIVTTKESVAWVDVTDPFDPSVVHVHDRGNTSSLWGDVKTVGDHAYVDGEGGGVLVFDMSDIDSGEVAFVGDVGSGSGHNIVACEALGLLARCGSSFRLYSVADDPTDLVLLGARPDRYVHDANLILYPGDGPDVAYRGRVIGFLSDGFNSGGTDTGLSIVDFGTPEALNPAGELISRVTWEGAGYSHQSALSGDLRWIYSTDETANHSTWQCFQIEDLDAPVAGPWQSNGLASNNHNSFIRDGRLFAANYKTGIRIFDCENGELNEEAYFDTYPDSDSTGYQGCWGVDPFLPSGTILASDMQHGLFVLRLDEPVADEPAIRFVNGLPDRIDPDGFEVVVDVESFDAVSMMMDYEMGSGDVGFVQGEADIEPGRFRIAFPASVDCPDQILFSFNAQSATGESFFDPSGPYTATYADTEVLADRFDGDDPTGWMLGMPADTAAAGIWRSRSPSRLDDFGPTADSGGDGQCFMTGDGSGDVDGGVTTLVTPGIDPFGLVLPVVRFDLWLDFESTVPADDRFEVAASGDGGESWALIEVITAATDGWESRSVELQPVSAPADIRIRFTARDEGSDSTVVAAIDRLELLEWICDGEFPGDMNGDGRVDGEDFGQFLIEWGRLGSPADFNYDGIVNGLDLGILLGHWTG